MALYPDYATAAQVKASLRITDTDDDTALAVAITAASRAIDQWTNRQFGLNGSAVPRYFTYSGECIDGRWSVPIFDVQTSTGLVVKFDLDDDAVYEQTVTYGTDFDLWPWNAQADSRPWTHLSFRRDAVASPICAARAIEVTANWGWSAVPTAVTQACILQAARFFTRRDSPYGIAGSPDLGSEMRLLAQLDPDVRALLQPYRKWWGGRGV